MSDHPHVSLGRHNLPVYEQPPNRFFRRLGKVRDELLGSLDEDGVDAEKLISSLGVNNLYYVIETFVPNIRDNYPEWEFAGYPSKAAFETDEYDEREDTVTHEHTSLSPTLPQYFDMIDTIITVNGGRRFLDALGKLFPPEWIRLKLAEAIEGAQDRLSGSPISAGTNGESQPTSSGETPQIEEPLGTSALVVNGNSSGIPLSV